MRLTQTRCSNPPGPVRSPTNASAIPPAPRRPTMRNGPMLAGSTSPMRHLAMAAYRSSARDGCVGQRRVELGLAARGIFDHDRLLLATPPEERDREGDQ